LKKLMKPYPLSDPARRFREAVKCDLEHFSYASPYRSISGVCM